MRRITIVLIVIISMFVISCESDINKHSNIQQTEYQVDDIIQDNPVVVVESDKGINDLTDNEIIDKIIRRLNSNEGRISKEYEQYHEYKYYLSDNIVIRTSHKRKTTTILLNGIEVNADQEMKIKLHMLIIDMYKKIQFDKIENL